MPELSIYSQNSTEPWITVVLNDDNSEVLDLRGEESRVEEAKSVLDDYIEGGLSVPDAVARLAGSYGVILAEGETLNDDVAVTSAVDPTTDSPEELVIGDGLMAMTDDAGTVVTLLRRDSEHGAVYRHEGEWHPVGDPAAFDGLAFVGVQPSAEGTYDKYAKRNLLVAIDHYSPSAAGPYWPHMVFETEDTPIINPIDEDDEDDDGVDDEAEVDAEVDADEEPLAASVQINSQDDLIAAIAVAVDDPDFRWYVERRVAALGLEASLPWQED